MENDEYTAPEPDNFDSRYERLQEMLSQGDASGTLPELVESAEERSAVDLWLEDISERIAKWLEGSFDNNSDFSLIEMIDWESTLIIAAVLLILMAAFFVARAMIASRQNTTRAYDSSNLESPIPGEADDGYLERLMKEGHWHQAMLVRWRIFQKRRGLRRDTTPLEFCYAESIADREPVNVAYRYIFGKQKAGKENYRAFEGWLVRFEGGTDE